MKNFINIKDISTSDLRKILKDAKKRKQKRKNYKSLQPDKDLPLKNKLLIQMFEKPSLRTRMSFYIAIRQLGGSALTLRSNELHLEKGGEKISDTAKILSSYADAFVLRTSNDGKLELFKNYLTIPLINGLSPNGHPAQILSDIFTIEELKNKNIKKLAICWIGDSNNVLNSLLEASVKFNFRLSVACPKEYMPNKNILKWLKNKKNTVNFFQDPKKAIINADVILTDKVISMNDKVDVKKKNKKFKKYKINNNLIKYAKKNCVILHCLPRGNEISEDIFNSKNSKVWTQALNRVDVQKSILLYCFNKLG